MRMRWTTATIVLAMALAVPAVARAEGPYLTARAAIVMDAASGQVLWGDDADVPLPPASTTKVMTAILALESQRLSETFRVSAAAAAAAPSSIGLQPGQRMELRDLLYALMLNSANDAAEVIAEGLAGSQAAFADRMTARARALGARSASFENPHGLTAPGHVASARDLAVLFRHALGLPLFRDVLGTRAIRVPVEASRVRWVSLRSHNRLLTGHAYPVIGKTGYTRAARRCFVGAASRGDREIIVALLGSTDL
jgi:D-alanyl-D-alanine carboxypeptidase (penicillin-binding protein 5/6)